MNIAFLMIMIMSIFNASVELNTPHQFCFLKSDINILSNYSSYNYKIVIPEEQKYLSYKDITFLNTSERDILIRIFRVNACIQSINYEELY